MLPPIFVYVEAESLPWSRSHVGVVTTAVELSEPFVVENCTVTPGSGLPLVSSTVARTVLVPPDEPIAVAEDGRQVVRRDEAELDSPGLGERQGELGGLDRREAELRKLVDRASGAVANAHHLLRQFQRRDVDHAFLRRAERAEARRVSHGRILSRNRRWHGSGSVLEGKRQQAGRKGLLQVLR